MYLFSFIDTNECEGPDHLCAVNATCMNTRGSYNCTCEPGFEGDGFYNCSGEIATDSIEIVYSIVRHNIRTCIDHLQFSTQS